MKCLILIALAFIHSAAADIAACEWGWSFYMSGNKCIKVFPQQHESWSIAQSKCKDEGGRLVTIPDLKTQQFVNKLVGSDISTYWIGLSDRDKEGTFVWLDGSATACGFQYWGKDEPNSLGDEDCVQLYTEPAHHWNDKYCGTWGSYICEKRGFGCEYNNGGCPGLCTDADADSQSAWSVTCSCNIGFAPYNGQCIDVNECSIANGGCDQICKDTHGSYECHCFPDFVYNGTQCVLDQDQTLIG